MVKFQRTMLKRSAATAWPDDALERTPRHGPTFPKKIPHGLLTTPPACFLDGPTITKILDTERVDLSAKRTWLRQWDRIHLYLFQPNSQTPTNTSSHCSNLQLPHGCSRLYAAVSTFWTFTQGHLICTRTSCLNHGGIGSRHATSWTFWICS